MSLSLLKSNTVRIPDEILSPEGALKIIATKAKNGRWGVYVAETPGQEARIQEVFDRLERNSKIQEVHLAEVQTSSRKAPLLIDVDVSGL